MAPRSILSGASATGSEHSVFLRARVKLTGVYVLILGIILLGFSAMLYQSLRANLADGGDSDFVSPGFHHHFVEQALAQVQNQLLLIDVIVLSVAAGISYVLAGYTLRPIRESMEAQRAFSENASHELRTPLAVMKSDTEVLLRNPAPSKEAVHATLRSTIEEIDRLSKLSADLLAIARSENQSVAFENVDVAEIAKKISDKMRPLAAEKGVSLNMPASEPIVVRGSVNDFERVFMNVLQNAIDHTPEAGSIVVSAAQKDGGAEIAVSDTGRGIDEKDLPHIFERFYKGPGAGGSGLGLSIVKEIITRHGGEIAMESTQGKGATVRITLPTV